MAKRVQRRRGTTVALASLSPAPLAGELLVDTTKQVVVVADGANLYPMAPESHTHAGSAITSGTVGRAYLQTMTGDAGGGGASGAVPAPQAGDAAAGKFLKADATWTAVPASGHTIEEEGTPVTQRSNLNFTGAGVSVADAGGKTVVTIPGGDGGSPSGESIPWF